MAACELLATKTQSKHKAWENRLVCFTPIAIGVRGKKA